MSLAVIVVVLFGAFTLVGGIIGFVKAKSKASLITGSASALLLFYSAHGISERVRAAYLIAIIVAAVLGVRFLSTWFKTRRLMPDFIMIILSSITIIVVAYGLSAH